MIDNQKAQQDLASKWGLEAVRAEISFVRSYDAAEFTATIGDQLAIDVELRNPESLATAEHGANTPRGPRLAQFDPSYEVSRTER